MPSGVQSKLSSISGNQKSGTMVGAFVMGALSSLIVTACVAPALIAALTVIAQTGDMLREAVAEYIEEELGDAIEDEMGGEGGGGGFGGAPPTRDQGLYPM